MAINSQSWESDLSQVWGGNKAIIAVSNMVSNFISVALFRNWGTSKSKIRPNLEIFDHCVKIGEKWATSLSQIED